MYVRKLLIGALAAVTVVALASGTALAAPSAHQTACVPAGSTGLTTVVVAGSGAHIHGTIDATGCNLGVYVPPGSSAVEVSQATITNSSDHAIFVQDATRVLIKNNTLIGDVTDPNPAIAEDKAIELVGTTASIVRDNLISDSVGSGGIGISDDGPLDPGAPNPGPSTPVASLRNQILNNRVLDNQADCGIVVAAYNAGGKVARNLVEGNSVNGNVAGIVIATDGPSTIATHNSVIGNRIFGNFIPGVIIHSNAPSDVLAATIVRGNTLGANGPDPEVMGGNGPTNPTAIILAGEVETITHTTVSSNNIQDNEYYGIWIGNAAPTQVAGLRFDLATVPVFNYAP